MFALLILPILISGYTLLKIHPYYFYKLHRFEGQSLYLQSALLGFICTSISFIATLFISQIHPISFFSTSYEIYIPFFDALKNYLLEIKLENKQVPLIATLIITSIASLAIAVSWTKLYIFVQKLSAKNLLKENPDFRKLPKNEQKNAIERSYQIALISSILLDSPLDSLLLNAYLDSKPLMLNMADRKIYIGFVLSMGEPNESEGMDQEIQITPLLSGYRDKDTLKIKKTTSYNNYEKIELVLRQENIVSATLFHEDLFDTFMKQQKAEEDSGKNLVIAAYEKLNKLLLKS